MRTNRTLVRESFILESSLFTPDRDVESIGTSVDKYMIGRFMMIPWFLSSTPLQSTTTASGGLEERRE